MNDQEQIELRHALDMLPNAVETVQMAFNRRKRAQFEVYGRCYAYCGGCYMPLEPAPKGNGKEGYVGFMSAAQARTLYDTTK